MLLTKLFFIACAGLFTEGFPTNDAKTCTLNLQTDTNPKKEPLILGAKNKKKNTYDFIWPTPVENQGVLYIQNNQQLLLGCPLSSNGNHQSTSGTEEAYAVCNDGLLTINGTEVNINSTSCSKSYGASSLNVTDTVCGSKDSNGVIVQLGFELEDGTFYPLAFSCFNITLAKTYWTRHFLMGASLEGGVKGGGSRSFSEGDSSLFPDGDPNDYYKEKAQVVNFNKILGDGAADKYLGGNNYLNRGHLAPHADFIFNTHRLMTYFYVNCAPQWYNFNGGNWETVETYTRSLAEAVDNTLHIWTGTYGILTLPNTEGVETEIYLDADNKDFPVPLVYWKIVNNPKAKTCTVAVGHNNPFLTSAPEPLCTPVGPYGWPDLTENFNHGYTYYCSFQSFKKVVDYLPDLACKKLFEFPK